jgi:hypothetical protein
MVSNAPPRGIYIYKVTELGQRTDDGGSVVDVQPATCQALSKCILEHVFPERLEGCTVLHLAALSGDHNMVIAVTTIWEEVRFCFCAAVLHATCSVPNAAALACHPLTHVLLLFLCCSPHNHPPTPAPCNRHNDPPTLAPCNRHNEARQKDLRHRMFLPLFMPHTHTHTHTHARARSHTLTHAPTQTLPQRL